MAITANDIKWKKTFVSDETPTTNGGEMLSDDITSTYFPNVTASERADGITRYRKCFLKQENADGNGYVALTLNNAKVYLRNISPAGDYFRIAVGTDTDVQDPDAEGYGSWSGVGTLKQDYALGVSQIIVQAEAASGFSTTSEVIIFNSTDPTEFEILTIDTISWSNNEATLTFSTPLIYGWNRYSISITGATTITNTTFGKTGIDLGTTNGRTGQFARVVSGPGAGQIRRIISNTTEIFAINYAWDPLDMPTNASVVEIIQAVVAELVPLSNIVATSSNWDDSDNANGGTYDEGGYPVKLFPVTTVTDSYTIAFTGDGICSVLDGSMTPIATGIDLTQQGVTKIAPSNLFEISKLGFSDPATTWKNGDSITFDTHASASAFWIKHVVPAGAAPHAGNRWDVGVIGDTA